MCRWALTHPLTISEYEKLKKQLKPDFEDMVPWYSGYDISQYVSSYTTLDMEKVTYKLTICSAGHQLIYLKLSSTL
jgi:hypothetical protein